MVIFICDFSTRVTSAFLASKTIEKFIELSTFQGYKTTLSFTLLFSLRFKNDSPIKESLASLECVKTGLKTMPISSCIYC